MTKETNVGLGWVRTQFTEIFEQHNEEPPMEKPEFFWSPPDGAPIVGITTYEGFIVVATGSGVYTIQNGPLATPPDTWTVQKISLAVRQS